MRILRGYLWATVLTCLIAAVLVILSDTFLTVSYTHLTLPTSG